MCAVGSGTIQTLSSDENAYNMFLPTQFVPSPVYPVSQVHTYESSLIVQEAFI